MLEEIILILIGISASGISGAIGWFIKASQEVARREREKLQNERRKLYMQILKPYLSIFADLDNPVTQQKALKEVASPSYRRVHYDFNMIGSDHTIKAMNNMVQHSRKMEKGETVPRENDLVKYWGGLLLAIRKDLGSKKSKLKNVDMLIAHINDNDKIM